MFDPHYKQLFLNILHNYDKKLNTVKYQTNNNYKPKHNFRKNEIIKKKQMFFNLSVIKNDIFLKSKNIKNKKSIHLFFKYLISFFNKSSIKNNKLIKNIIPKLFVNLFLTHDVHFFAKKMSIVFFILSKSQILRTLRNIQLLNQLKIKKIFNFFNVLGLYIKISGKFNGFGGAKKLKKHVILHQSKFTDKNVKISRNIQNIRHKVGLTTISVFSTFRQCLMLILIFYF